VAARGEEVADAELARLVRLRVHRDDRRRHDTRDDEPDDQEQAGEQKQLPAEAGRGVLVHLPILGDCDHGRVRLAPERGAPCG